MGSKLDVLLGTLPREPRDFIAVGLAILGAADATIGQEAPPWVEWPPIKDHWTWIRAAPALGILALLVLYLSRARLARLRKVCAHQTLQCSIDYLVHPSGATDYQKTVSFRPLHEIEYLCDRGHQYDNGIDLSTIRFSVNSPHDQGRLIVYPLNGSPAAFVELGLVFATPLPTSREFQKTVRYRAHCPFPSDHECVTINVPDPAPAILFVRLTFPPGHELRDVVLRDTLTQKAHKVRPVVEHSDQGVVLSYEIERPELGHSYKLEWKQKPFPAASPPPPAPAVPLAAGPSKVA